MYSKNKEMAGLELWMIPNAPLRGLAHHLSFLSSSAADNVGEERNGSNQAHPIPDITTDFSN